MNATITQPVYEKSEEEVNVGLFDLFRLTLTYKINTLTRLSGDNAHIKYRFNLCLFYLKLRALKTLLIYKKVTITYMKRPDILEGDK